MTLIRPTTNVPELSIPLLNGEAWKLSGQSPENFTVVIFYRGYHCPVCQKQLEELQNKLAEFGEVGASVLALSMDSKERAQKSYDEWDIKDVTLGYGLSEQDARAWGLFLSEKMEKDASKVQEPQIFSEPGMFLIRPDGTLYASSIQTMPFARPPLEDIIGAIKFVNKNGYPPRGDLE